MRVGGGTLPSIHRGIEGATEVGMAGGSFQTTAAPAAFTGPWRGSLTYIPYFFRVSAQILHCKLQHGSAVDHLNSRLVVRNKSA